MPPLPKLLIAPDATSYNGKAGVAAASVKLDGGAPRYRKDKLGATHSLNVQWTLNPANYNYIMAFYRTAIAEGALPFLIDLLLEKSAVEEHTAYIVPDTFGLLSHTGLTYVVGATLDVLPKNPTSIEDTATIAAGPQY